jgi:hypothetical protein
MHYDMGGLGQSEPGGPEKLLLLQSLAISCIGLINDLATFTFSSENGRGEQASTSSEMLKVPLIALIRLLGEVIVRVDWLHTLVTWGLIRKCGCGLERGEATKQTVEEAHVRYDTGMYELIQSTTTLPKDAWNLERWKIP